MKKPTRWWAGGEEKKPTEAGEPLRMAGGEGEGGLLAGKFTHRPKFVKWLLPVMVMAPGYLHVTDEPANSQAARNSGLGTSQPDPVMRHHQGGGLALRARGRQPPLHQCTDAASVLTRKCIRGHSPTRLLDGPGLLPALPAPGVGAGWGYLHLWHKGSASITRAESLAVNAVVSSETTHPQPGQRHSRAMAP